MKRSALTLVSAILFTLLVVTAAAQPDRETAVTHPLDCAYYLLAEDSLEDTLGLSLTYYFFKVGRYDEALRASKFDDNFASDGGGLIRFALERFNAGDPRTARQFADAGFRKLGDDQDYSRRELTGIFKLLLELSDSKRIERLFESGGEEKRFIMLIALAEAHAQLRNNAVARQTLDEAMRLPDSSLDLESDTYSLLIASQVYRDIGSKDQSIAALDKLGRILGQPDSDPNLYHQLFRHYYLLGQKDRAMRNWDKVEEKDDVSNRRFFSSVLIEAKEPQKAEAILDSIQQTEFGRYPYGKDVAKQYLQLGRGAKSESVADRISADPDSYDQQGSYMLIADHFIAAKNTRDSRRVIEKAFGRARRIEFEHLSQHSIGASPGSRKSIFLREISERFQKLGDLNKALEVLRSLNDRHEYARELLAGSLAKFANENARRLPKKHVFDLLNEALSIARKVDADEAEVQVMAAHAEVLAKLRDRTGATDKLAELLESRKGENLEGYALLVAGEVFEKYKLPLSDRLRFALLEILEEHDL